MKLEGTSISSPAIGRISVARSNAPHATSVTATWNSLVINCGIDQGSTGYAALRTGWVIDTHANINTAEEEYIRQKEAFLRRSISEPLLLAPYRGRFVASRDGQIVDSDIDLAAVTNRFFSQYGDVPVYIGRVDGRRKVFLDSPNRTR